MPNEMSAVSPPMMTPRTRMPAGAGQATRWRTSRPAMTATVAAAGDAAQAATASQVLRLVVCVATLIVPRSMPMLT
jgi:hypothetical protein